MELEIIYKLFCVPIRRRIIMMHWSRLTISNTDQIYAFINRILYEPIELSVYREHLTLFYPIQYKWLNGEEKEDMIALFAQRKTIFDNIKCDLDTGHIELSKCKLTLPIGDVDRRQMVRDYVMLIVALKRDSILSLLLCVVQRFLYVDRKKDLFLINLHGALQGRCTITEIPAWNLAPWDIKHTEESETKKMKIIAN